MRLVDGLVFSLKVFVRSLRPHLPKIVFCSKLRIFNLALIGMVCCQVFFNVFWVDATSFWWSINTARKQDLFFGMTFYNLGVFDNLKNDIREVCCCIGPSGLDCQYEAGIFFANIH